MITFLYRNRVRHKFLSDAWLRAWIKRVWGLPSLLCYWFQAARWRLRGARISDTSVLAKLSIHGSAGNLLIGDYCCLGRVFMQAHDRIQIGTCVVINDGVKLITGSHDIHSPTYDHKFAPIVVEDFVWIAMDALILQGVNIGRGAVVSAGAVVTQNVPPLTVVGGNPAREIGRRSVLEFRYLPVSWFGPVVAWVGRNPAMTTIEMPGMDREAHDGKSGFSQTVKN